MAVSQQAGELRERVSIQMRTQAKTAHGSMANTWVTLATVWAGVVPVGGSEFQDANAQVSQVTHKVRIRYFAGLSAAMRFLYRGRTLNILKVINLEERKIMQDVDCKEVTNEGTEMLDDSDVVMLDDNGNAMYA